LELDLNDLESFGNYTHGKEFLEIPSTLVGKKTLLEWFYIDDYSSWWLVAPIIHPKFKEATRFIDRIFSLIEKFSVTSIKLEAFFDKSNIVQNICKLKGISFEISRSDYFSFTQKQRLKNSVKKLRYKKITKKKWEKRLDVYNRRSQKKKIPSNCALITSPGIYRRETWDPITKQTKNEEFFIKPIIDELALHNISTLLIDLDYTFRGTTRILQERLSEKIQCMPIETLITKLKSKNVQNQLEILKKSLAHMKKHNVEHAFEYKGISVWNYIKIVFEDIFLEPNLPTYLHLIETATEFFKETKPNILIQVYEVGPYAKALEIAARKTNIRTIGVQHGLIPTDTPDYIFNELRTKDFSLGNFIPDLTLVFGNYYKKILVENSAYPNNSVMPMGNPSFYNIKEIKKIITREQILSKYKIDDKKIVLFPFSFRFTYITNSPDRILLEELYKSLQNNDDVIVVVRPHPGDKFNQKTLQEICPCNNFVCSKVSLIEDLILCDLVVIAPVSTVSSEAALLEKPVFFVDVLEENVLESVNPVYHELISNDVVKLVTKKELFTNIMSIKKGELWKTSSSKKRTEFVNSFFNINEKTNLFNLIYPKDPLTI